MIVLHGAVDGPRGYLQGLPLGEKGRGTPYKDASPKVGPRKALERYVFDGMNFGPLVAHVWRANPIPVAMSGLR